MAHFFATQYAVGGLYTHGGDLETHYDDQPAGLTRVLDQNDDEWRETRCEGDLVCWVPYLADEPMSEGRHCSWVELLDEFGPLWDGVADNPPRCDDWAVA